MSESTETVQATEQSPKHTDRSGQFEAVAALLRGDEGAKKDEEGKQEEGSEDASKGKPRTLKDLASRLGLPVEELYNIEVGMPGDDGVSTLGAMKDHFQQRQASAVEQMRWREQKATEEGASIRARTELAELMSMLPKESLRPEILQKIRDKHSLSVARERSRTLEVIPEWNEEPTRTKEIGGMREHLIRAGFESGYLDQITDHRTMRYIRENMLREQRVIEALALVKRKDQVSNPPSGKGDRARAQPGNRPSPSQLGQGRQTAQIQQIAQLLNQRKD